MLGMNVKNMYAWNKDKFPRRPVTLRIVGDRDRNMWW